MGYVAIFAIAITQLIDVVRLVNNAANPTPFAIDLRHAEALQKIETFHAIWPISLLLLGLHLALIGYRAFTSGHVPRTVGVLLAVAGLGYLIDGFGELLVTGYTANVAGSSPPGQTRLAVGAALMLVNCAIVVGIAILARPMPRRWSARAAHTYLAGRAVEALALAAGVVFLLGDRLAVNDDAYQIGMTAAGLAGLVFCTAALRVRLFARWLAVWGLVGYAVFTAGAIAELLGYGMGVALSVPGGLFEVALGIVLLARGFPPGADAATPGVHHNGARQPANRP